MDKGRKRVRGKEGRREREKRWEGKNEWEEGRGKRRELKETRVSSEEREG